MFTCQPYLRKAGETTKSDHSTAMNTARDSDNTALAAEGAVRCWEVTWHRCSQHRSAVCLVLELNTPRPHAQGSCSGASDRVGPPKRLHPNVHNGLCTTAEDQTHPMSPTAEWWSRLPGPPHGPYSKGKVSPLAGARDGVGVAGAVLRTNPSPGGCNHGPPRTTCEQTEPTTGGQVIDG